MRKLMKSFQRVKRACEEIERCHIAIHCLYTAILNENDEFNRVLSQPHLATSSVYSAVQDFVCRCCRVNHLLLIRLNRLVHSPDFSGSCSRGTRLGSNTFHGGDGDQWVGMHETAEEGDEIEEIGGDETDKLVSYLVDYVGDLALL